jgi:hypothetical protein
MNGLAELSVRPLASFDEHVANATADRIRRLSADASRLSWDLDEALRGVRRATSDEVKAAALSVLEKVHARVCREFTILGF